MITKTKPFKHQVESYEYSKAHDSWLLSDEQGCISGDDFVKIKEAGKPATRNIRLKYLFKLWQTDKSVQIKSLVNGRFAYMPIKTVVDKGIKETLTVTLENTKLTCTPDHLIYTQNGWIQAKNLSVGDKVFTNGKQVCPMCGTDTDLITYKYSKFIGYCKACMYKNRNGKHYKEDLVEVNVGNEIRLFGKKTRTMPNYKDVYGMGIPRYWQVYYEHTGHVVNGKAGEQIHHINGIHTDDRFENLKLVTASEHMKLHMDTNITHLYQFNENLDFVIRNGTKIYLVPQLQTVISVTHSGTQQVYDVQIDSDEIHNFIVNSVIVHNCGKSKQVIDIAVNRKFELGYQHCLIICGVNGLKWNWVNEVHTHSDEQAYILGQYSTKSTKIGNREKKIADVKDLKNNPCYFIITNIETIRDNIIVRELQKMCKAKVINMIAVDEIHKAKSPSSMQGKGLLKLQTECMIAMTGTPIMNNPLDLFMILKWLGYETHSFTAFKNHYCVLGGFGGYEVVGYRNMDEIQETLNDMMLRRLKEDVLDLPDKIFIDEYVDMTAKQEQIYNEVLNNLRANIDMIKASFNPLAQLTRLRQATGYTGILSSTIRESAKLTRMKEIVDESISNNRKVVIFSNWVQMIQPIVEILCKDYNVVTITGETKPEQRQQNVDKFQNDKRCNVIVGTIGAMGTGLTLTAGTVEIFLDEPWTMAAKSQAVDRCHRIGAKTNVTIYTIMCKGTIDEKINQIVQKKGMISDILIDGAKLTSNPELIDLLIG